jgi:hypothetical protein
MLTAQENLSVKRNGTPSSSREPADPVENTDISLLIVTVRMAQRKTKETNQKAITLEANKNVIVETKLVTWLGNVLTRIKRSSWLFLW